MTLKEILCMYAPHGVEVQWLREDDNQLMVSPLTIVDYPFLITKKKGKPLLRPMSSITEEIEHNGERFVTIERINSKLASSSDCDCQVRYDGEDFWIEGKASMLGLWEVTEIQRMLLEMHFDVFGGIGDWAIEKTK